MHDASAAVVSLDLQQSDSDHENVSSSTGRLLIFDASAAVVSLPLQQIDSDYKVIREAPRQYSTEQWLATWLDKLALMSGASSVWSPCIVHRRSFYFT